METKMVSLANFLTAAQMTECRRLYADPDLKHGKFARTIHDRIIKPDIERINNLLCQENDPMFLAYCVEYILLKEALHAKNANSNCSASSIGGAYPTN